MPLHLTTFAVLREGFAAILLRQSEVKAQPLHLYHQPSQAPTGLHLSPANEDRSNTATETDNPPTKTLSAVTRTTAQEEVIPKITPQRFIDRRRATYTP
jgi:hypothetical protein